MANNDLEKRIKQLEFNLSAAFLMITVLFVYILFK